MRYGLVATLLLLCATAPATAQVSIGINIGSYPNLIAVPGYPVYYAPDIDSNFFFYDGLYWVYQQDSWYSSSWYNGPWEPVDPLYVPIHVLQIPVRYYRQPPAYFRGWQSDRPPHWGDHWGHDWTQRRNGWDRPTHAAPPVAATLPSYQRQYGGKSYPGIDRQRILQNQNYRYRPQSTVVRPSPGQQPDQRRAGACATRHPAAADSRDPTATTRHAGAIDSIHPTAATQPAAYFRATNAAARANSIRVSQRGRRPGRAGSPAA